MRGKVLRLGLACEFLLAIIAIYTAWSEIGEQSALDIMPWPWKFALGVALAIATVGLTAALTSDERFFTARTAQWLAAIVIILATMGVVTYYYSLQVDEGDSDDGNAISTKFNQPARVEFVG